MLGSPLLSNVLRPKTRDLPRTPQIHLIAPPLSLPEPIAHLGPSSYRLYPPIVLIAHKIRCEIKKSIFADEFWSAAIVAHALLANGADADGAFSTSELARPRFRHPPALIATTSTAEPRRSSI